MTPRSESTCGRCRTCHPGKQLGGDSFCRDRACRCHRAVVPVNPFAGYDRPIPGVRRGGMELHNQATYDGWGSE